MYSHHLNIAYKNPVAFREGKLDSVLSNLDEYDIHPFYAENRMEIFKDLNIELPFNVEDVDNEKVHQRLGLLQGHRFDLHIQTQYTSYNNISLDEAIDKQLNFIYPLMIYNTEILYKYNTIDIDKRVLNAVLNGKCKIIFSQVTEGFFGRSVREYKWLSNLAKKIRCPKDALILLTGNLKANEQYESYVKEGKIEDNYTILQYSHFNDNLWFSNHGITSIDYNKSVLTEQFEENFKNDDRINKKYHFLCFNRVPKYHRTHLYGELNSHPDLKTKSISSLGGTKMVPHETNPLEYYYWVDDKLSDDYKHGKNRLLNFYRNHNSLEHVVYDEPDLENNKANNLNISAHNKTFVNIVTESLFDSEYIFFSEKTFKPIFLAQPFIIVGNPHSLKKLREMGFKTFDRWWDESYDEEENLVNRLEKIVDVMLEISSWDLDKCNEIIKEMESILRHNFEVMISGKETFKIIEKFTKFKPETKKLI